MWRGWWSEQVEGKEGGGLGRLGESAKVAADFLAEALGRTPVTVVAANAASAQSPMAMKAGSPLKGEMGRGGGASFGGSSASVAVW